MQVGYNPYDNSRLKKKRESVSWDRCNLCGKRFPSWPELRDHKDGHTQEEIDAKTLGRSRPLARV